MRPTRVWTADYPKIWGEWLCRHPDPHLQKSWAPLRSKALPSTLESPGQKHPRWGEDAAPGPQGRQGAAAGRLLRPRVGSSLGGSAPWVQPGQSHAPALPQPPPRDPPRSSSDPRRLGGVAPQGHRPPAPLRSPVPGSPALRARTWRPAGGDSRRSGLRAPRPARRPTRAELEPPPVPPRPRPASWRPCGRRRSAGRTGGRPGRGRGLPRGPGAPGHLAGRLRHRPHLAGAHVTAAGGLTSRGRGVALGPPTLPWPACRSGAGVAGGDPESAPALLPGLARLPPPSGSPPGS